MSDTSMALQRYVAAGNLRDIDSPQTTIVIEEKRRQQLQKRLAGVRDRFAGVPDASTTNPRDFRAALQYREDRDYQRDLDERQNGKDIPRLEFQNPALNNAAKQVYKAHDFVTSLPHPGGLGAIILVIVVLFLILIPATGRGETRGLLLWEVFLGRKAIYDPSQAAPATGNAGNGGAGAGGGFSSPGGDSGASGGDSLNSQTVTTLADSSGSLSDLLLGVLS